MKIALNEKRFTRFKRNCFLWIGTVGMILALSDATYAAEPLTISHTLVGYTDNGPTVTLDFSLDITNNGTLALTDAEIIVAPIGPANRLLEPIPSESRVYIGNIPASTAGISVNYTITSIFILPQEELNNLPLFWEIKYTDEANQTQFIIVESRPATAQ